MLYTERTASQTSHCASLSHGMCCKARLAHTRPPNMPYAHVRGRHVSLKRASVALYCASNSMPGSRKSPFIGKTVPLDSVLYPRYYDDLSKVTLDTGDDEEKGVNGATKQPVGQDSEKLQKKLTKRKRQKLSNPTEEEIEETQSQTGKQQSAVADKNNKVEKRVKRKKQAKGSAETEEPLGDKESGRHVTDGQTEGRQETEDAAADIDTAGKEKKKKKKEKKKPVPKTPSGPGNAEEAQQIRSIMGFAVQNAEAKPAAKAFSFGFTPEEGAVQAEDEPVKEEIRSAIAEPTVADKSAAEVAMPSTSGRSPAKVEGDPFHTKLQRVMHQGKVPRRVFVGGMPFSYEEEDVREYWSYCGEIESLDLMRFPDTGRFKGIAFITFADESGYKEALKCDGVTVDEQTIRVEPCLSAGPKARGRDEKRSSEKGLRRSSPAPKTPGYHVAYVGNVAFEAGPNDVKGLFSGCSVKLVRLHTDKDSGKSKGYAHVHFEDEASLDRAMQYDGSVLMGRGIKIGYAQPKKT